MVSDGARAFRATGVAPSKGESVMMKWKKACELANELQEQENADGDTWSYVARNLELFTDSACVEIFDGDGNYVGRI